MMWIITLLTQSSYVRKIIMKNFALLATVVGISACSLSEDKFQTDIKSESCRLFAECAPELMELAGWEDQAACEAAETEEADTSNCTYDAAKAKECLDEAKAADCDAFTSEDFGSACDEVYTCDEPAEEEEEAAE